MSKKISGKGTGYSGRPGYESSFISDVINTYNDLSSSDIETEIAALKNIIIHIKKAAAEGRTPEEIEELVLYNMSNLFSIIKYPNLTNFYQLRTLEYMMDLDLEPYVVKLLEDGVDLNAYEEHYRYEYSANVENNVYIELCGLIQDFIEAPKYTSDAQFLILKEKARRGSLTIEDKEVLMKYIKLYLKELQLGKSTYWEEQKKDLEACRKLLLKHKDDIFDVVTIDLRKGYKSPQTGDKEVIDIYNLSEEKKAELQSFHKDDTSLSNSVETMGISGKNRNIKQVSLKDFSRTPFISENRENNFLIIMSEALNKFKPIHLSQFYEMLMASEYGKSNIARERGKEVIYNFLSKICFQKNLLHAREYLMERLSTLMTFYRASGCLEQYCDINNNKLSRIYLGNLGIDQDTLFGKFVNDDELAEQYFIDENSDFSRCFKGTPISYSSDEAIIGMSAFYTNRMTKQVPVYSMLGYILDKTDAIERICENPDIEYEDLGYTEEDIATYMAMYKCFQKLMIKSYFADIPTTRRLVEKEVHRDLSILLHKFKNVYENYYPDLGFDFERDIDWVMMDAQLIQEMYDLKAFSVKSLLYTAITDKKKNIINWGFVPEDEQTVDKFALLGFDIKTLNTPLFVHMKRDELIEFLAELTGTTQMPVYEGANNMYSYTIKQRVTAQVLYPLSKEEKKRLYKIEGTGALTDYYKHIKWLQQGKNPPLFGHMPESRVYDFITRKIEKVRRIEQQNISGGKKNNTGKADNRDR